MQIKILFISKKDKFANFNKYEQLEKLLSKKYSTIFLNADKLQLRYFYLLPKRCIILFARYLFKNLLYKIGLSCQPLIEKMTLRAKIIKSYIYLRKPNCIIIQLGEDLMILTEYLFLIKVYDSPTPFADEIKYSRLYSKETCKKLEEIEKKAISSADIFCTSWATYTNYLKKKYQLTNTMPATRGCEIRKVFCRFNKNPKIAFVGKLGYWVNIPLLNNLCHNSVFPIDVYGNKAKKVDKKYYRGYLKNLDRLTEYQFGLITISKDPLRKIGFSAKHLLYISYGLPVLCPEWRQDKILAPATIPYNEKNFNQVLKKYSQKSLWLKKHKAALRLAKQLRWEKTLKPLVDKIDDLLKAKNICQN